MGYCHEDKYGDDTLTLDPFYTPEEWKKKTKSLLKMLDVSVTDNKPVNQADYQMVNSTTCQCVAHTTPEGGVVGELIDIPEPLNDDTGNKLASILIQLILEKAGLADTVTFENCKQGSPYTINYVLQIPNGEATTFTGWPDFSIITKSGGAICGRSARLAGIGEIQFPPGMTKKSKTAAIAQAGIYGVGQLAKTNKITVVVIFKDKSAIVTLSSITPAETLPNSLGEPSFQFVN